MKNTKKIRIEVIDRKNVEHKLTKYMGYLFLTLSGLFIIGAGFILTLTLLTFIGITTINNPIVAIITMILCVPLVIFMIVPLKYKEDFKNSREEKKVLDSNWDNLETIGTKIKNEEFKMSNDEIETFKAQFTEKLEKVKEIVFNTLDKGIYDISLEPKIRDKLFFFAHVCVMPND